MYCPILYSFRSEILDVKTFGTGGTNRIELDKEKQVFQAFISFRSQIQSDKSPI